MKKPSIVKAFFGSLMGSVLITLVVMTVSFLMMMFSSGEDGYRSTLFNTIFFKSTTDAAGAVDINFGLTENYLPLIILLAAIFVFLFSAIVIYGRLKVYKEKLLVERNLK